MVVRDPAGTTPEKTGNLCFVCNSRFPSDKTAQHAYALWRAAVSLSDAGPNAERFLDKHYWTNAAMHGSDRTRLKGALRSCSNVLAKQVELLEPKVIIASGQDASETLYRLGLLGLPWSGFREHLSVGAYIEHGHPARPTICCTYHTSVQAVNLRAAPRYSKELEEVLRDKIKRLSNQQPAESFLRRFPPHLATGRGMRVLLSHWLDIGVAVRAAHGDD